MWDEQVSVNFINQNAAPYITVSGSFDWRDKGENGDWEMLWPDRSLVLDMYKTNWFEFLDVT